MKLRDELALNAPNEVPYWFASRVGRPDASNLPYEKAIEVTKAFDEEAFFQWRYYFADKMLEYREKQ